MMFSLIFLVDVASVGRQPQDQEPHDPPPDHSHASPPIGYLHGRSLISMARKARTSPTNVQKMASPNTFHLRCEWPVGVVPARVVGVDDGQSVAPAEGTPARGRHAIGQRPVTVRVHFRGVMASTAHVEFSRESSAPPRRLRHRTDRLARAGLGRQVFLWPSAAAGLSGAPGDLLALLGSERPLPRGVHRLSGLGDRFFDVSCFHPASLSAHVRPCKPTAPRRSRCRPKWPGGHRLGHRRESTPDRARGHLSG